MSRYFTPFFFLCALSISALAEELPSRMTIFLFQTTRQAENLKQDAALIANTILSAKPGDEVSVITTDGGRDVLNYHVSTQKTNPMERKRAQTYAIALLKSFFTGLFNEPPSADTAVNDVAEALALALERFNAATPYERMSLVLLGSGLQADGVIDFTGAYPNGAWIIHELSPFSAIPRNTTKATLDCVVVHQRPDYVNAHHKRKIKEWYWWLFDHSGVNLTGFTYDHQTASQILVRGAPSPRRPPPPMDLNGDLELISVGRLVPVD